MNTPSQTHSHLSYGRFVVRVTMAVVLLLACVSALLMLEQRRTQREMGPILTAFFSDEILRNVQDLGAERKIQIVVLRKPENPWASAINRRSFLLEPRSSFSESSLATRVSFLLTNVFPTDIHTELHLPGGAQSFFIARREIEETRGKNFEARFPNNFGYFVVSHVGLNPGKTEAILYVDHFCGGLCGSGGYYLMRNVNGVWHVVDQHVIWIS
jgi:hypothetical protein